MVMVGLDGVSMFQSYVVMWAVLLFIVAAGATCPKEPSVHPKKPAGKECPGNEIWVKCPLDCPSEYCSKYFNKIKCPPPKCAPPGCRCRDGFLRDDNTLECIPANQCPKACPDNEYWEKCPIDCPSEYCSKHFSKIKSPAPECSVPSCRCRKGYLRDDNTDLCVPENKCSLQCGYNEKLVDCRTICPPQNCDLPYTEYYCTEESKRCEQGCDCIEDHFRNASGICVPSDQCASPLQCGYNEKLVDCRTICPPQNCDLPYTDYYCTEESKICEQGCDCIEDHFRNASGICVPSEQCAPPLQCGYNEKLVDCRTICPPQNCDLPYTEYYCTEESKRCEQGCDCIEDHFRNASGICVPSDKCAPPNACGHNEQWSQCQTCPRRVCHSSYVDDDCEPEECEAGCECIEGHFRNSNGECVAIIDCAITDPLQCGINEELVDCKRTCPPQVCEAQYVSYLCAAPDPEAKCEPGCMCIEGHLRDESDTCIPVEDCPPPPWLMVDPIDPVCPENEVYTNCSSTCPEDSSCTDITDCKSGCQCQEGYIRNPDGSCEVSQKCGVNEELLTCLRSCPPDTCDTLYFNYPCANPEGLPCQSGCRCKQSYLRYNGTCVAVDECPPLDSPKPVCSENETNVDCAANAPNCKPGCRCKDGYLRDLDGNCVRPQQAPVCPPNEFYDDCVPYCPPGHACPAVLTPGCEPGCKCTEGYQRNQDSVCSASPSNSAALDIPKLVCSENETNVDCAANAPNCKPGCRCKDSYLRDLDGNCVRAQQAPVCPPNESYDDCVPYCPPGRACPAVLTPGCEPGCKCTEGYQRNQDSVCSASPNNSTSLDISKLVCSDNETNVDCAANAPNCKPGCRCKDGYLRDPDGNCVRPQQSPVCPPNEFYDDCVPYCPPGRACPAVLTPGCEPGCKCTEGYQRNQDSVCSASPSNSASLDIPKLVCSENETNVDCAANAPNCKPGCRCKDGYLRDLDGNCVRPQQSPVCPPNESYDDCVPYCPPGRACPAVLTPGCEPGCKCTEGYQRNQDSVCSASPSNSTSLDIPKLVCSENETNVDCAANAPNCKPGCRCKDGYLRDLDGNCVRPQQSPVCPPNESYDDCVPYCPPGRACPAVLTPGCEPGCKCTEGYQRNQDSVCSASPSNSTSLDIPKLVCSENETNVDCAANAPNCKPGCRCKDGYLRDLDGNCVRPQQAPVCSPNESYDDCVPYCPPGRACPAVLTPGCTPGCKRQEAFKRKQEEEECSVSPKPPTPPTCPANEYYYNCVPYCPPGRACAAVLEPGCKPGCKCKQGYKRNRSGKCVRISQPPTPPTCPANEYYYNCVPYCPPGRACAAVLEPGCEPGCKCKQGYKRNGSGKCVLIPQPPTPPTCPANEYYYNCVPYCPPGRACAAVLEPGCEPGCKCKQGYERNGSGGCVLTQNTCNANETYVQCQFDCPTIFCPTNEYSSLIACSPPYPCPPGCVCSGENVRRRSQEDRTCIPIEECPAVNCSKPHEVWDYCPSSCLAENCEDANKPQSVCYEKRRYCQPKCICEKDYYRNASGICVPASECLQNTCGANELYSQCSVDCPTVFCPENEFYGLIACDPPYPCPSGCSCKANFKRLSQKNRTCVPDNECPPVNCSSPYEIWDYCPSACLAEKCEDMNKPVSVCTEERPYCRPKCVCDKGHYRNSNGTCVPALECPKPKCEGNQTEVYCPTFKCPNRFCPVGDDQTQIACKPPRDCPSGCGCDIPYRYRSEEDLSCVLAEDCPPQECTRPNEEWDPCPQCLAESCTDAGTPQTGVCNTLIHNCEPKCVCKKGYFRNDNQTCVSEEDCSKPKCEGNQTEVYCPTFKCPNRFCPVGDDQTQIACKPPRDCPSGCGCDIPYRYRSEEDLSCVLAEDCPPQECTRPNEEWDPCPQCLAESCADADVPQTGICNTLIHNCEPKCVCKKGYFRNDNQTCVSKEECFKCKENERYVACKASCPTDFCPEDDNQDLIACDPPLECTGGCICKLNYRLKSYEDPVCIPVEQCPKVNCTRAKEVWATCPSPCLQESCESAYRKSKTCNYLVHYCNPKCICEKGHFRNGSRICVPKRDCPSPRPKSSDIKT